MRGVLLAVCLGWVTAGGAARAQPARPPDDVARALEKMQHGGKLTADEARAVQAWMTGAGRPGGFAGAAGGPAGSWMGMETHLEGKTLADFGLCPGAKVPLPAATADRGAYLAVVKKVAGAFAQRDAQRAAAIDEAIGGKPERGAKLAGALLAAGDAGAAMYATARAAAALPDDTLLASNLGVMLAGKRELVDAQAALSWADARTPGSTLVLVNRGWLAYTAGDEAAARALFERARALDGKLAAPRVGLGLLAGCAGKPAEAAEQLRPAATRMPSKATTLALALSSPADPAPEWKGSVPLALPPPPLSRDPARAAADLAVGMPLMQKLHGALAAIGPGIGELMKESQDAYQKDGNPGMDVERYRSVHKPYREKVHKLSAQVVHDVNKVVERYAQEGPAKAPARMRAEVACPDDRCRKALELTWCLEDKALVERLHGQAYDVIQGEWRQAEPAFVAEWDRATGMLERLQSKAWSGVYGGALERDIVADYVEYVQMAVSWATIVKASNETVCVPPPPPPPPPGEPPPLPKSKLSELCDLLDFDIQGVGWAVNVHCSSSTYTFALPGNSKLSITQDPLQNETRIHYSMSASERGFNFEQAVYFEQSNGLVDRVGTTFEASAGLGPLKEGLAGDLGFAAIEGGPPYDFKPFADVWRIRPHGPGK